MNKITSVTNNKIKDYSKLHQKKYRETSDLFSVEGEKPFEEIIAAGVVIEDVFVCESSLDKYKNIPKLNICNEAVMKKLSSTDSPASIVTVAQKPQIDINMLSSTHNVALLENIKDAGNLGTIIRSAAAFDIDALILYGDTVDLYNSKVIRSAAGNFFKIPTIKLSSIEELKSAFDGFELISTALTGKPSYNFSSQNKNKQKIIMLGSEASGLTPDLTEIADYNYIIPINKTVESLNLSVAASIVFYELFKQ